MKKLNKKQRRETKWKKVEGFDTMQWKEVKFIYELPKKLMGHVIWANANDRNPEGALLQLVPVVIDHFAAIDEMDWLVYRALMWEAGFYSKYAWIEENKFYYNDLDGVWKWERNKIDSSVNSEKP